MDREKILKEGKVEIRVIHSGIAQKFEFKVVREKIPGGEIPFLKTERQVNAQELLNIANSCKLPVIAPAGKFFPRGMGMKDFLGL
jgi:hypothetical protein